MAVRSLAINPWENTPSRNALRKSVRRSSSDKSSGRVIILPSFHHEKRISSSSFALTKIFSILASPSDQQYFAVLISLAYFVSRFVIAIALLNACSSLGSFLFGHE